MSEPKVSYEFDVGYRDELSFAEVLALDPGTMLEAQDGTKGIVILDKTDFTTVGFPETRQLLLFHPAHPAICWEGSGYTRFKVLKPVRILFRTRD